MDDERNNRICIIDLKTYEIKEYFKFNDSTWKCFQIYGKKIVKLQSEIYILD